MSKPFVHAMSSAKRFGGKPDDYMPIHQFFDSSKSIIADHRHRCMTHNSWFIGVVLERVFGVTLVNSDGKEVSVRDVGEQHVMEDFNGSIPSAADFLTEMEYREWMGGRGSPPSHRKLSKRTGGTDSINDIIWD